MGFIETAMGDVPEEQPAPEGRYDLRVVSAKVGDTKKKDRKKLAVAIEVLSDDPDVNYETVFETLVFPNEEDWKNDSGRNAKMFILKLKRFMGAFNCPWEANGFEVDQIQGAEAESVLLTVERGDDGVERNTCKFPRIEPGS